jgi:hypothetical protein
MWLASWHLSVEVCEEELQQMTLLRVQDDPWRRCCEGKCWYPPQLKPGWTRIMLWRSASGGAAPGACATS